MNSEIKAEQAHMDRRQFLAAVGAAGASLFAVGNVGTASAAVPAHKAERETEAMSFASLQRVAGSVFTIKTSEGTVHVRLDRVREDHIDSAIHQYTAVFSPEGKAADQLTNNVYELRHPVLGKFSLLLSPSASANSMTASFCQLVG